MTNSEKYDNVFCSVFEVGKAQLDGKFTFADVKSWDSLTHLTLISGLEDAFDIMFETEDILHFGGYENGKKILTKYGVEF